MDDHTARIEALRRGKDEWMRYGDDSPLEHRGSFTGLKYYPIEPALRFRATLVRHPQAKSIVMQTSDGAVREYRNLGHFEVTIEGKAVHVQAYAMRDEHELFIPFRDQTSGKETYGAGRYLDLHPVASHDVYDLDFNLAYNPMCAYSESYSCPFPPPENWLQVPIRAGEKNYE